MATISGQNMEAIVRARDVHDRTCRYGGKAIEVHMTSFDITRCGWDEGDNVGGLTVVADDKLAPGRFRVYCDIELHGGGCEIAEEAVTDAVADQRELVPAGTT